MYKVVIKRNDVFEEMSFNDKENAYFVFHRLEEVAVKQVEGIDELLIEERGGIIKSVCF